MKMRQKLIIFLAIAFGILFIGIGKVHAADINLSPSTGIVGSSFTITTTGNDFKADQPVIVKWDSVGLTVSNSQTDGSGGYSSSAQVPAGASVGPHTVKVTGPGPDPVILPSYGPKNNWIARIFPRALAAEDIIATKDFTVTAPPVTPPANTNTAVANSNTQSSNTNIAAKSASNKNSNQTVAETPAPAVTTNTNTNEQTTQTEPTNETKKEAKVCYFPWWLWLVLILITVVNLVLFWLRYWKKKPKQGE